MKGNLRSNLRKIIEQNLEIYKNSQSDSCAKEEKSLEYITSVTQKQLIVLEPTVLLTRCEQTQTRGPDNNNIQSNNRELPEFLGYDDWKMSEFEANLSNQGNIDSNVKEISNLTETEDHETPFINVHSQTVDKLILKTRKKREREKKPIDKPKKRRARKRKETISSEQPSLISTPIPLQSSDVVANCNLLPSGNLESEIFPQTKTIANKNVDGKEKKTIKKSLRTRKPVMSASYYDAVESSPKKKNKSKHNFSSTSTFVNAPNSIVRIEPLPEGATASEVRIFFPESFPLKDKCSICIHLDKMNLTESKKSAPKKPRKSYAKNNSNEATSAEKSDIAKYLEGFSTGYENHNFDGSVCASPMNNNNSTISAINYQDQSPRPHFGDLVIVHPNQNSRTPNIISLDSSGVIINDFARKSISNQVGRDAGLVQHTPIDTEFNTTNAPVGVNTSNAPAGPGATIDGTQMEDFEFPLDIDNNLLYEYIESGGEIFNQTNTNQQLSQSENIVRTPSSSNTNNLRNTKENVLKRQLPAQVDMMPIPGVKISTLPEPCENRNRAHSQKSARRLPYSFISEDVLDLSVQKAKSDKVWRSNSVMDLTVSSCVHESIDKEEENVTKSNKNSIDLPRNTPQTLHNENIQRISFEEYKRRRTNTEKPVPQSLEENKTKKIEGPKHCDKDCVACENVRILNNPLAEYDFNEPSSIPEKQSLVANQAGPSNNSYSYQSPATKDSGIGSEDCGNKSAEKNSSVSLKEDSTPNCRSKEEEGLKAFDDDDDALSIFIHSTAGSPFYFSEYDETGAEDVDGSNANCENRDEIRTPSPPNENCNTEKNPATADIHIKGIANGTSDSKKVFKIPKLMHSTLKSTSSIQNANVLDDLSASFLFPECSMSLEHSKKPENFTFTTQASVQSVEKNFYNRKDVIVDIFGNRPCFMYLAGNCQKPNCKFSHEIIDCNIIRFRLTSVSNMTLNSGYCFISRNRNLFRLYFPAFCDTFSQRGDRKKLMAMIRDCQLYQESINYLKSIAAGFVKTGMSQVDAVKVIKDNFISTTTEAIDVLVDLIVDSDVSQFVSTLESYVGNPQYKFKMEAINKLAYKCNRTKHLDVIQVLLKIVLFQIPRQEIKHLQCPELVHFLDMVRNSHLTQSVQNDYDSSPDRISHELFPPAATNSSSRAPLLPMPALSSSLSSTLVNNLFKRP